MKYPSYCSVAPNRESTESDAEKIQIKIAMKATRTMIKRDLPQKCSFLRAFFTRPALAVAMGSLLIAGTAMAAPANDDFASAIDLTGAGSGQSGSVTSGSQSGTDNIGATQQIGETVGAGGVNTVWFKWTSPADGNLNVKTLGSTTSAPNEWDAVLGIYTGASVNGLTALGGSPQDGDIPEEMTVPVTAGTTYRIQTAGWEGDEASNILLTWNFVATVYQADILTFGPGAVIGAVSSNAAAITWPRPEGTTPGTFSPTFTLSPGATCAIGSTPVVSGDPVNFSAGPVVFTVTAQGVSPIVNNYTVTAVPGTRILWNISGGGVWNLSASNWLGETSGSGRLFANGDEVKFNKAAGGTIVLDGNLSPLSTTVSAASGTYNFSAAAGGGSITTGSLIKDGAGTLVMAKANGYAGGTIINSGTLELNWPGDGVSHTTLGTGPVTLNGGTLFLSRTDLTNALTVNGGNLVSENGFGNNFSGPITLNATLTCNIQWPLTCSGDISGTGGLAVGGSNNGRLTLSGNNSYQGPTTVTGSTLQCNSANALGGGALSISGGGAKVNLNYTGAKSILSLTLGGVAQTATGTYGSLTSNAIYKSGYFAGSGTVKIGDPDFAAYITSFGTNLAGSAVVIDPVVSNSAAIKWYVPSGTNPATLAPAFVMSAGATCSERNSGDLPVPGFDAGPVVYTVVSPNTLVSNVYTVTVTVLPNESTLLWGLSSGGTWNRTTFNWLGQSSGSPTPYFDGVNVIFSNTAGGLIVLDGNLSPLSTIVSAASGTYDFRVAVDGGSITTGSLTKNGAGTLAMAKANSYAGGTSINNGTLELTWPGDGVSHTTLGIGPVTLNGGTLLLSRTDLANALTVNGGNLISTNGFGNSYTGPITLNATLPCNVDYTMVCTNTISGPGGLTKNNGGPMVLSGTNTYTGPTSVTGGTLQCDNVNSLGGGALSISGGGAKLNLNYGGTRTVASLTLGGVAKTASGTYGSSSSGATFQDDNYFTSTATGTVTVGGAYDTWAGGAAFDADANKDGVTNGLAWFLGAANPSANANGLLPLITQNAGDLVLTFDCLSAANRGAALLNVQYSNDLGQLNPWTSALVPGVIGTSDVGSVHFVATANGGLIHVVATIPASGSAAGKLFGRLAGVSAP